MQTPIRPIAVGLLLALNGMPVLAKSKPAAAPPAPPVAAPALGSMDLSLHSPVAPTSALAAPALQLSPASILTPSAATSSSVPLERTLQRSASAASSTVPSPAPVAPAATLPSEEVQRVARWVTSSRDNANMPYLLVDKANARVWAFNRYGQPLGTAPALLGMARGDRLLASNDTNMAGMTPQVRVTPAGRFLSQLTIDSHGKELLVLDYNASISLHAVVKGTPEERRAERLNSASIEDNRISYGCINVPAPFYSSIVSPTFTGTKGVVYVLPEMSPASALFGLDPVGNIAAASATSAPAAAAFSATPGTASRAPAGAAPAGPQGPSALGPRAGQSVQAPDAR